MTAPINEFKPDDKVLTKVKGVEVGAVVRLVWNNEVQVRTADGALRWRTTRTVAPLNSAEDSPEVGVSEVSAPSSKAPTEPEIPAPADAIPESVEPSPAGPASTEDRAEVSQPFETESRNAPEVCQPATGTTEVSPCGVPETEAARKRGKKARRRR